MYPNPSEFNFLTGVEPCWTPLTPKATAIYRQRNSIYDSATPRESCRKANDRVLALRHYMSGASKFEFSFLRRFRPSNKENLDVGAFLATHPGWVPQGGLPAPQHSNGWTSRPFEPIPESHVTILPGLKLLKKNDGRNNHHSPAGSPTTQSSSSRSPSDRAPVSWQCVQNRGTRHFLAQKTGASAVEDVTLAPDYLWSHPSTLLEAVAK